MLGLQVLYDIAGGVNESDSPNESVDGAGIGVGAAEDIAAEGEFTVREGQLAEEGGGQVGLVAEGFNATGAPHRAACPYYRYAVAVGIGLGDIGRVCNAMVGSDDEQEVFPFGRGF